MTRALRTLGDPSSWFSATEASATPTNSATPDDAPAVVDLTAEPASDAATSTARPPAIVDLSDENVVDAADAVGLSVSTPLNATLDAAHANADAGRMMPVTPAADAVDRAVGTRATPDVVDVNRRMPTTPAPPTTTVSIDEGRPPLRIDDSHNHVRSINDALVWSGTSRLDDAGMRRLLPAKAKKNTTGRVPAAIIEKLVRFAEDVAIMAPGTRNQLPVVTLQPPRVTKDTILQGVLPNPSDYESSSMTLLVVDWNVVKVELRCPKCTTVLVVPRNYGNSILRPDSLGVSIIVRTDGRPCFSCAAVSECPKCRTEADRPERYRHDDPALLATLEIEDQQLYPCDPWQSSGLLRPDRALVVSLVNSTLRSDSGFATVTGNQVRSIAELAARSHVSFSSVVKKTALILEQNVSDAAWAAQSELEKRKLRTARERLLSIRATQRKGLRAFGLFDDKGAFPFSFDPKQGQAWVTIELKRRKTYRIREQQAVDLSECEAAAMDGCPRLGKAAQVPGDHRNRQLVCFTGGRHKIVCPILTLKGTFGEVEPAVSAGVESTRWKTHVMALDDLGAAASWHQNGDKFRDIIPDCECHQDGMHQISRVARTQLQYHDQHSEAVDRIKRCYRFIPDSEFNRIKEIVCSKPVGSDGGLRAGCDLLISLKPRESLRKLKADTFAMSHEEFNRHYLSQSPVAADGLVPNTVFEHAFERNFEHHYHDSATIRSRLGETYRWSAGPLGPPCGNCDDCATNEQSRRDDWRQSMAVRRHQALATKFYKRQLRSTGRASEIPTTLPATASSPVGSTTPTRTLDSAELHDADSGCRKRRRTGLIDAKNRCLNSVDSRAAFENAIRNADHAPFPSGVPRMLPLLDSDDKPVLDGKGLPKLMSQGGTSYAENVFSRCERVMASHAGYGIDTFTLLGGEFASQSNTDARRELSGEPDLGHNRLDLVADINRNYVTAGEPPFYHWHVEPEPDDGRRYWGDYCKQNHPDLFASLAAAGKVEAPPPPYIGPTDKAKDAALACAAAARAMAAGAANDAAVGSCAMDVDAPPSAADVAVANSSPRVESLPVLPPVAPACPRGPAGPVLPLVAPACPQGQAAGYRAHPGGPLLPLPEVSWMLSVDIKHKAGRLSSDGTEILPCVCPRVSSLKGQLHRDKQHPRVDCLHGIVLKLQQRERTRSG